MRTGVAWFVGFAVWLVFLPNAPYVLTDVLHLRADLYASPTRMHTYGVLARYAVLLCNRPPVVRRVVAALPPLSARDSAEAHGAAGAAPRARAAVSWRSIIGRFMRLNSWDVVFVPRAVLDAVVRVPHPSSVAVFVAMFLVIGFGTFSAYAVGEKLISELRRVTSR